MWLWKRCGAEREVLLGTVWQGGLRDMGTVLDVRGRYTWLFSMGKYTT